MAIHTSVSTTGTWGPARITLAFTAGVLGLLAFFGGIVFLGGLGGHNVRWLLCGGAMVVIALGVYVLVRSVIRRVAGYPVTLQDN